MSRIELINRLNNTIVRILKLIELGDYQPLSQSIISVRSSISTTQKLILFRKRVITHLDENPRLNLKFNRSRAVLHMTNPKHHEAKSLLKQFMEQVPICSFKSLKRDSVPWHVELIGEGATDAGRPARDLFTQMCLEIMHPSTGLFISTPNKRNNIGNNQDLLIPNSYAISNEKQQMFIYTGLLITIAFISRLQQPFKFSEFVWACLTGANITINDIYSVDSLFEKLIKEIENGEIDEDEAEKRGMNFTIFDSHGKLIDLFPGGSGVRLTQDRMNEYVQLCKKFRIKEIL